MITYSKPRRKKIPLTILSGAYVDWWKQIKVVIPDRIFPTDGIKSTSQFPFLPLIQFFFFSFFYFSVQNSFFPIWFYILGFSFLFIFFISHRAHSFSIHSCRFQALFDLIWFDILLNKCDLHTFHKVNEPRFLHARNKIYILLWQISSESMKYNLQRFQVS